MPRIDDGACTHKPRLAASPLVRPGSAWEAQRALYRPPATAKTRLPAAGSGSSCQWKFPKWFGCVMTAHESLAGGLIGAAVVLLGAWIAWIAVQQQISFDRERAVADREEVERLLSEGLTEYAEGMAAAWRLLVALPKEADPDRAKAVFDATAYMAERVSRP